MSLRSRRLRSPRALILFLSLTCAGAGAFALLHSGVGHARLGPHPLWTEGQSSSTAASEEYAPRRSLAPLIAAISPAVVSVRTERSPDPRGFSLMIPFGGGGPGIPPTGPGEGIGSGFLIRGDGLVVTNHHVVAGSEKVEVKLADGRRFAAKVLGSDPHTDVALLALEGARDLPTVKLGDSEHLAVGDWVLAIGSPMGLEKTATTGILSAKKRGSLGLYSNSYVDFLQTDAAISPGNSGGPLFNLAGEVVGINTAIAASGRGLGFAVPIDQVKAVLPQLHAQGKVERGWLGIAGRDIEPAIGEAPRPGAIIGEVQTETPAAAAGLRAGDRILAVDGQAIANFSDLRGRIAERTPGTTVRLRREREGATAEVTVTLGHLPNEADLRRRGRPSGGSSPDLYGDQPPRLGIEVEILREGVIVRRIRPGSVAADLGLREGDHLREINGITIRSRDDIGRALAKDRQRVEVTVDRGGATHTAVLERR